LTSTLAALGNSFNFIIRTLPYLHLAEIN
jgi:hypothetical protein